MTGTEPASRPVLPAAAARTGDADGDWHRVHPLTPAIRSWQALVLLLVVIGQDWGQSALRGESHVPGAGLGRVGGRALLSGGAVLAAVLILGGGFAYLSWRMTRFRVTEDALELHHGVISRRQRRARLDRLQAVDVVQPLVARLVGLARLNVEVAGGSHSKIELSYLTQDQAQRLRNHLLARAAGVRYDTVEAPEAPEHYVLEVPLARLAGSLALSAAMALLVLIVAGLVAVSALTGTLAPVAGVLPAALAAGSLLWQRFAAGFGFRVSTSPDGLRLRHGLLEHRTQTVPPGRVQALRLSQPLLWRANDWWRVRVNVAGYGHDTERGRDTENVLLPVGTRDEAIAVLSFVLPDLGVAPGEDPRAIIHAGLSGSGEGQEFVVDPPAARWLDPLAWRRNGYRVTGQALVIRRGRLHRHLDLVPHARTQSCGVRQAWLQRLLGLASFHLHSTPGPVSPVVPHLASGTAAALLWQQTERARNARRAAGPERWMERIPGPQPGS